MEDSFDDDYLSDLAGCSTDEADLEQYLLETYPEEVRDLSLKTEVPMELKTLETVPLKVKSTKVRQRIMKCYLQSLMFFGSPQDLTPMRKSPNKISVEHYQLGDPPPSCH